MSQTATRRRSSGYGVLTLGVIGALLAATGAPDAETLAAVTGWGVPETVARAAMYVLPVAGIMLAIVIGQAVGKGRSTGVRWIIYALLGAVAGFFLGLCLELFAGMPAIIAAVTGPLAEPTILDISLWALTGFSLFVSLMIGGIALFGRSAVAALQVEEATDEECLEVRRAERGLYAWSALGMLTLGVSTGGLAIARTAPEDGRLLPVIIAVVAALVSALANYVLWRSFDEMQRRHVVEGYAASAVVATLGAFLWAALQSLGYLPSIDAVGVLLTMIFVQLIAVSYVTSAVMGQLTLAGKAA